jgi:hypothetical protein
MKPLTFTESNKIDEMDIEININCRLVKGINYKVWFELCLILNCKDYQKSLYLKAICRRPQIELPIQEVLFVGKFISEIQDTSVDSSVDTCLVDIKSDTIDIPIRNVLVDPLHYEIVNETNYFNVETLSPDSEDILSELSVEYPSRNSQMSVLPPLSAGIVRVSIDRSKINANLESLRRVIMFFFWICCLCILIISVCRKNIFSSI